MKKLARTVVPFVPHLLVKRAQERNYIAKCREAAGEPGIGIFWVLPNNEVLSHVVDISQAEPYGDFKTDGTNHFAMWKSLKAVAKGRPEIIDHEYEYWPRGRVSYNVKTGEFFLYADRKIVDNPPALRAVMREFSLPAAQTEVSYDPHYKSPGDIGGNQVPYQQSFIKVQVTYDDGETTERDFRGMSQLLQWVTQTYGKPEQGEWQRFVKGENALHMDGDEINILEQGKRPLQQAG